MITGSLKNKVDRLWTEFWGGGITNPLTVIEQISFLMFSRLLDITETRNEKRAARMAGQAGARPPQRIFRDDQQDLRWSHLSQMSDPEAMLQQVRTKVFPHFKEIALEGSTFAEYMRDAQLLIQRPELLARAVSMINDLPLTEGDTKGDLYEYLLSKLTTAGISGQFRTPRHIIDLMVFLADPRPTDVVGDPACGTAGFLVRAMEYLQRTHTSPEGIIEETDPETGRTEKLYTGDLLAPYRDHIQRAMFHGWDFDVTMLRIAAMNLLLHGLDSPNIHYRDTLSNTFADRFPALAENAFDVILANPPFKGTVDESAIDKSLTAKVKTKKTELLFLVLFLRMLRPGGRCAVIVPSGVLFGASKAHVEARRILVEENQLEAVIALPSGVFKPYAGVSTAILLFTRGGRTADVFFYDVEGDGYTLDDKRQRDEDHDDVNLDTTISGEHGVPARWTAWKAGKKDLFQDRTAKSFAVSADDIRANSYDLSVNRYREANHQEEEYDEPKVILAKLKALEQEIAGDLAELEGMLG